MYQAQPFGPGLPRAEPSAAAVIVILQPYGVGTALLGSWYLQGVSGFVVKAVVFLIVIALIVVLIARFFRRVTPAKAALRRQRMPLLVVLVGAVLLAAGFILGLAAFASQYTAQLLPARIASAVLFVAGVAILIAYRNWYLEVGADAVHFRTVLGQEKR